MKISEKMLEDWICEDPGRIYYFMEILGRQIKLEHGVLDILAWSHFGLTAIELKKGALKEQHVGQVMRYAYDINVLLGRIWDKVQNYHFYDRDDWFGEFDIETRCIFATIMFSEPRTIRKEICTELYQEKTMTCKPMLIGKSIDDSTYAAAAGGNVEVLLWHPDPETGTINTFPCQQGLDGPNWDLEIPGWAIDAAIREAKHRADRAERIFDLQVEKLFFDG